jgi:hypothetical protein
MNLYGHIVTPAQAGVQKPLIRNWIPAFAGMTFKYSKAKISAMFKVFYIIIIGNASASVEDGPSLMSCD